jgi:hypothetical protein
MENLGIDTTPFGPPLTFYGLAKVGDAAFKEDGKTGFADGFEDTAGWAGRAAENFVDDPIGTVGGAADDGIDAVGGLLGFGDDPPPPDYTTDTDGDGLTNWQEVHETHTDPAQFDSDGDLLGDGSELRLGTDPWDVDTDSDGLDDGFEAHRTGTDPHSWDTDGDGWSDGLEVRYVGTDPLRVDTDGDGLSDPDEGMVYRSDPHDFDSDDDGLSDGRDVGLGYSATDADSDDDGVSDFWESQFVFEPESNLVTTPENEPVIVVPADGSGDGSESHSELVSAFTESPSEAELIEPIAIDDGPVGVPAEPDLLGVFTEAPVDSAMVSVAELVA